MRKRVKHIRDGLALVLVLAAIALAAVLGFAMLSGAALQTRTTSNAANSAAADYLGESGINIAMYYLQYPEQAPSLNGSGYWAGTGGDLAVGSGWVNVTVTRDASNNYTYEIVSIGKMGNSLTQITRTKQARVYVRYEYKLKYATGVNGSTNFYTNTSISGDVLCNGDVTVQKTVTITGSCYCKTGTTVALGTAPAGGYKSVPTGAIGAPTNADVNMYTTKPHPTRIRPASGIAMETSPSMITSP